MNVLSRDEEQTLWLACTRDHFHISAVAEPLSWGACDPREFGEHAEVIGNELDVFTERMFRGGIK